MATSRAIEPFTSGIQSSLPGAGGRGQRQIVEQARQRYLVQRAREGLTHQASDAVHSIYGEQRELLTADAYDIVSTIEQFPDTFLKPFLQATLVHQLQMTARHYDALLAAYVRTAQDAIANPFLVDQRNGFQRLTGRKPTYESF